MRHLKLPFVLFILLTNLFMHGQGANFSWAQRFGGNLNDNCNSVCDNAGNAYRLQGGIAKHNSAGTLQWTITTAYYPVQISFDSAGDLYLIGTYANTVDLDHGPGTFCVTSAGVSDIAVVKLSGSNGNFIWGGSIGSSGNDYDAIIFTDPTGNSYIGGSFTGAYDVDPGTTTLNLMASATDFFVSKLNSAGNFQWAKHFVGTASAYVSSFDLDSFGNIYACGSFSGTVDFDPGAAVNNLSSAGNTDMYVCKLDGAGNFGWVSQIGATGQDNARHLEIGANGNIYCTGAFTGLVDFDSGPGTLAINSGTLSSVFVAEFSNSGTPNWVQQLPDISVTGMALDKNNGICLTGSFRNADFNPGPGTFTMAAFGGTWPDIFICKLRSSGSFLWAKMFGNINNDDANTISIDGSNNIHIAGRFKTTCDFDPNNGNYPLTAAGGNLNYDAFMLKLCQTPDQPAAILGGTTLCNGNSETFAVTAIPGVQLFTWNITSGWTGSSTTNSILVSPTSSMASIYVKASNACGASYTTSLSVTVADCTGLSRLTSDADQGKLHVYPNPSTGLFTIDLQLVANITITDVSGKIIFNQTLPAGTNTIDLRHVEAGIYFLSTEANSRKANKRLVKD